MHNSIKADCKVTNVYTKQRLEEPNTAVHDPEAVSLSADACQPSSTAQVHACCWQQNTGPPATAEDCRDVSGDANLHHRPHHHKHQTATARKQRPAISTIKTVCLGTVALVRLPSWDAQQLHDVSFVLDHPVLIPAWWPPGFPIPIKGRPLLGHHTRLLTFLAHQPAQCISPYGS